MKIFLLVAVVFISAVYTCEAPDCDNVDLGSCGNACCLMEYYLEESPEVVADLLRQKLDQGGLDGRFDLERMNDGSRGIIDYSRADAPFFMGKFKHHTASFKYVDDISLQWEPSTAEGLTKLRAFSISLIGGAYGDAGQNFKNIHLFMKTFFEDMYEPTILLGCGH